MDATGASKWNARECTEHAQGEADRRMPAHRCQLEFYSSSTVSHSSAVGYRVSWTRIIRDVGCPVVFFQSCMFPLYSSVSMMDAPKRLRSLALCRRGRVKRGDISTGGNVEASARAGVAESLKYSVRLSTGLRPLLRVRVWALRARSCLSVQRLLLLIVVWVSCSGATAHGGAP